MKKLLTVLVLSALIVSSASATVLTGMITKIAVLQGGDVDVTIDQAAPKKIRSANSNKKEFYAMLLTAYTAGKTIKITHEDGIIKTVAIVPPAP